MRDGQEGGFPPRLVPDRVDDGVGCLREEDVIIINIVVVGLTGGVWAWSWIWDRRGGGEGF